MVYAKKSESDINEMRKAGLLVWEAHQKAKQMMEPGYSLARINNEVEKFIVSRSGNCLFKGQRNSHSVNPFPAAACLSVNEVVVHGIPSDYVLKDGDILSIDIGIRLNGWCSDAAITYPIGNISDKAKKLLEVTENTLRLALAEVPKAKHWLAIAKKMDKFVRAC